MVGGIFRRFIKSNFAAIEFMESFINYSYDTGGCYNDILSVYRREDKLVDKALTEI